MHHRSLLFLTRKESSGCTLIIRPGSNGQPLQGAKFLDQPSTLCLRYHWETLFGPHHLITTVTNLQILSWLIRSYIAESETIPRPNYETCLWLDNTACYSNLQRLEWHIALLLSFQFRAKGFTLKLIFSGNLRHFRMFRTSQKAGNGLQGTCNCDDPKFLPATPTDVSLTSVPNIHC